MLTAQTFWCQTFLRTVSRAIPRTLTVLSVALTACDGSGDPAPAGGAEPSTKSGAPGHEPGGAPPDLRVLRPPAVDVGPLLEPASPPSGRTTYAYQFNAPIYLRPSPDDIVGLARRGQSFGVARWLRGEGCQYGWLELATGGYVCNELGFDTSKEPTPLPPELQTRLPADAPLPFTYARVLEPGIASWTEVPTVADEEGSVAARTEGVVFIAIEREHVRDDGEVFVEDVRRRFFRKSDLFYKPAPTLQGQVLDDVHRLPLAFVHAPFAVVEQDDEDAPPGLAIKFTRFVVEGTENGQARFEGGQVPRATVRIARELDRPEDVDADDQWIHVDLDQQTLVAYEGDRPVYATVVSSGKPGYEPQRGTFRIGKKYVAKKMAGEDVADGSYDIDQVPYIMYYWGSFALHGAYWHDDFGNVRSHGCTNLSPADARWLFRWAEPALPPGWLGKVGLRGPWVHVTRSPAED